MFQQISDHFGDVFSRSISDKIDMVPRLGFGVLGTVKVHENDDTPRELLRKRPKTENLNLVLLKKLESNAIKAKNSQSDQLIWDYILKVAEKKGVRNKKREPNGHWNSCNLFSFKEYVEEFH